MDIDIYRILASFCRLDFVELHKLYPNVSQYDASYFSSTSHESWRKAVNLWRDHGLGLLAEQPQRPCPACGKNNSDPIYTSYDQHSFHSCRECGCWFVPYLVDEKLFQSFFAICPEAEALAKNIAQERLLSETAGSADHTRFDSLLNALESFNKGSLLDIGANAGQFVAAAAARDWRTFGLENDIFALQLAKSLNRMVVENINLLPQRHFDVVTLWETIEHIADPLETLSFAESCLAPGGVIILTFPNLNNIALQQLRGDISYSHGGYNTAGHINMFGRKQLTALLERAGLKPAFWDASYSSDYAMSYAYLLGKSQGAREDIYRSSRQNFTYPPQLTIMASYFALLERETYTAPILFCIACRASEEHLLHESLKTFEKARKQEMRLQLETLSPPKQVEISIPFQVESPTSLKLVVFANNPAPWDVEFILADAQIETTTGEGFSLLPDCESVYKELLANKTINGTMLVSAVSAKYEYLLSGASFTLSPGDYLLRISGAGLKGECGIGLQNTKTEQWQFTPRILPKIYDAAPLFRSLYKQSESSPDVFQTTTLGGNMLRSVKNAIKRKFKVHML